MTPRKAHLRMVTKHPDDTTAVDATVRELMDTITALRDALETEAAQRQAAVQAGTQTAADEAEQLQAAIAGLRDELERCALEREEAVQSAVRTAADEITQLKSTVMELRSQLEERDE